MGMLIYIFSKLWKLFTVFSDSKLMIYFVFEYVEFDFSEKMKVKQMEMERWIDR